MRLRSLRRLPGDRGGVSALEFALLAPVMIAVFFGVVETGQVILAGRRTGHAASAVSDLVAQVNSVSTSDVNDCFSAAVQLMSPLATSAMKMKVTSVTLQSNGKAVVDWSQPYNGMAADTKGATYSPPANMLTNTGDSVIISTATYTLVQATKTVIKSNLAFTRVSYAKPRNGTQVTHS